MVLLCTIRDLATPQYWHKDSQDRLLRTKWVAVLLQIITQKSTLKRNKILFIFILFFILNNIYSEVPSSASCFEWGPDEKNKQHKKQ